ncbi:MAG: DUF3788 domain-containing protein [Bacteroidales bacterium]|jgi:hypothetical protein|nr:DUF3788 domain-containing protein [Bacteroidales bacterium]
MATSYFEDKALEPRDKDMEVALGSTYRLFEEIFRYLVDTYEDIHPEWKHYGKKIGWQLKLFKGKRNIMFIVPFEGHFIVYFSFGDKAVQQVMESNLSNELKTELQNAKKYMEGRGINLPITENTENIDHIIKLIEIKINS